MSCFCVFCLSGFLLGVSWGLVLGSGVCLVVLFVWVVLVPGGLVFPGFVVSPG